MNIKYEFATDKKEAYWLAEGDGPIRFISVESDDISGAINSYNDVFEQQYAIQESRSALSLLKSGEIDYE